VAGREHTRKIKKLAENLRDELGVAFDVRYPKMPDEASPDSEAWKDTIARELAALNGEVVLVGHSVGAFVLLKYLTEEAVEKPVAGLFLVSAPFVGTEGWQVEEDALREDFASKLPEGLPVFLYHSRDDEWVPYAHLALYAEKLPQATIHEFDGRGHQFDGDLSEVARDIKQL
jgi:predicted alpha/beta hydrolase family esterase